MIALTPYAGNLMQSTMDYRFTPQKTFLNIVKDRGKLSSWIDINSTKLCKENCRENKIEVQQNPESPEERGQS